MGTLSPACEEESDNPNQGKEPPEEQRQAHADPQGRQDPHPRPSNDLAELEDDENDCQHPAKANAT